MALRDQVVELVLKARNKLSKGTDAAAESVESLSGNAEGLQDRLRGLEDQKRLISQFDKASKAVDKTGSAYDKAQVRLEKLKAKLDGTGPLTKAQATEFEAAQKAVDRTGEAYEDARGSLDTLANEAEEAGVDVTDLAAAQRENEKETVAAKRAISDLNDDLDENESRVSRVSKALGKGVAKFAAWGAAAAAAGAAAGVAKLASLTRDAADFADQLNNTSTQLGINATKLQELGAATRTVGIEQDELAGILENATKNIGEAVSGGGKLAPVLEDIGLAVEDLVGLEPDEQLLKISDAITGLGTEQQVSVLEKLSSGASKLLPLLENNADSLRRIIDNARERGAIIEEDELQQLLDTQKALNRIQERLDGVRNKIVAEVAPAFEDIAKIIDDAFDAEATKDFSEAVEGIARQLVNFTRDTVENFGEVKSSLQAVVDTGQFLGNSLKAVFRGVQAAAATVLVPIAKINSEVQKTVAGAVIGLEKIGLASEGAVAAAVTRADAAQQSVKDLRAKVDEYGAAAADAGSAAANAFDNSTEAANKTKEKLREVEVTAKRLDKEAKLDEFSQSIDRAGELSEEAAEALKKLFEQITEIETREAGQEAITKLTQALDQGEISAQEYADKLSEVNRKLQNLGKDNSVDEASEDLDSAAESTKKVGDEAGKAKEKLEQTGEAAEEAGEKTEQAAQQGGGAFAIATDVINGFLKKMEAIGPAVSRRFRELASGQKIAAQETQSLEERIDSLDGKIQDIRLNALKTQDATGLGRLFKSLGIAAARAERAYVGQLKAVRDLNQAFKQGTISGRDFIFQAEAAIRNSNLLNEQDLSGLRSGIEAARQQMESLRDSTEGTLNTLQDELDRLQGNTEAIERRRFEQQIRELEEKLDVAREIGDQRSIDNAKESLALAKEIKAVKDEERKQAAAERAQERKARQNQKEFLESTTSGAANSSNSGASVSGGTVTLDLRAGGQPVGTLTGVDSGQASAIVDALEQAGLTTTG